MLEQGEAQSIQVVNGNLKLILETETSEKGLWMKGFTKSVFVSELRHTYFTLTENDYSIDCVLYRHKSNVLDFTIHDAMEIEVYGKVGLYEQKCYVQFQVENARLIRQIDFTINSSIQQELEKKGLLPKKQKALPPNIKRIAVITSKQSKVTQDFEHTYNEEAQNRADVKIFGVPLEGAQAAQAIANEINRISKRKEADVIVLIRGGGSESALATFNSLLIAEAICLSDLPVVTGIGHQKDKTVADAVADYPRITATAAASFLARASSLQGAIEARTEFAPQIKYSKRRNAEKQRTYLIVAITFIIILALVIYMLLEFYALI